MSSDFWLGMACIPTVIGLGALAAAGVLALIWASASFAGDEYKLLKRVQEFNRAPLAATVATAKWVRYSWIPGWHLILCRTSLSRQDSDRINRLHANVEHSIADAVRRGIVEHATDF